jgi:hypothetical protein
MSNNKFINKKIIKTGGNGYSFNITEAIAGRPAILKYTNNCQPVFPGELLQNGGIKNCGCSEKQKKNKEDPLIFEIMLENLQKEKFQNGGGSSISGNYSNNDITKFNFIKNVAEKLKPLSQKELISIPVLILEDTINKKKINENKKFIQFGGFSASFQDLLAPLGQNNLIVLAALLLLHYVAVKKSNIFGSDLTKSSIKKGGFDISSSLSTLANKSVNCLL